MCVTIWTMRVLKQRGLRELGDRVHLQVRGQIDKDCHSLEKIRSTKSPFAHFHQKHSLQVQIPLVDLLSKPTLEKTPQVKRSDECQPWTLPFGYPRRGARRPRPHRGLGLSRRGNPRTASSSSADARAPRAASRARPAGFIYIF